MKTKKFFQYGDHVITKHEGIQRYGYIMSVDEPERAVVVLYESYPHAREVISRHFSRIKLVELSAGDVERIVGRKGQITWQRLT